jgi:hypothetical protein
MIHALRMFELPVTTEEQRSEHRRTCSVCSTLGVNRSQLELSFREFTPAGEIIELTIKQSYETLEDQDIRWAISQLSEMFPSPVPAVQRPARISFRMVLLFVVLTLLIVTLFGNLPL